MAEGSVESVGLMAKIGSAGSAGAMWGIFAAAFMFVPAIFGSLFAPLLSKANKTVTEKINRPLFREEDEEDNAPAPVKMKISKAERDYQLKMEVLADEKRQAELQAELAALSQKRARKKSATATASRTI
jgi:hypothetical protein